MDSHVGWRASPSEPSYPVLLAAGYARLFSSCGTVTIGPQPPLDAQSGLTVFRYTLRLVACSIVSFGECRFGDAGGHIISPYHLYGY